MSAPQAACGNPHDGNYAPIYTQPACRTRSYREGTLTPAGDGLRPAGAPVSTGDPAAAHPGPAARTAQLDLRRLHAPGVRWTCWRPALWRPIRVIAAVEGHVAMRLLPALARRKRAALARRPARSPRPIERAHGSFPPVMGLRARRARSASLRAPLFARWVPALRAIRFRCPLDTSRAGTHDQRRVRQRSGLRPPASPWGAAHDREWGFQKTIGAPIENVEEGDLCEPSR